MVLSATRLLAAFTSMALLTCPALGHGGMFRGPSGRTAGQVVPSTAPPGQGGGAGAGQQPLPIVYPGSGPQIPFNEERWEFWWEYNQDYYVNLRERLEAERPQQGIRPFAVASLDDKRRDLIPFLVTSALKDEDDQVRSAAVFSLAKLADPFTVPYLEHIATSLEAPRQQGKFVYETHLAVRTNAVVALGVMQSARAVDTLRSVLQNDSEPEEVRAYAATSLGMIGGAEASGVLKQALEPATLRSYPYQLRLALCYAIGQTHDPDNAPFVRSLVSSAEGEDYLMRALLVQSLGQLADSAANKLLLDQLRSKETMVRRSATVALGAVAQAADKEIVEGLMRTAKNDSDNVTMDFAYIALGRIAAGGAAPAIGQFLLEELGRATHQRRAFILLALGLSKNRELEDRLIRVFEEEKEPSLRAAAAISLALLKSTKAAAPIRTALEGTPDPVFRSYAALALGMIGDQACIKTLKKMLIEEVDVELLYRSAIGLGLLGDRTVIPDLLAELKRKTEQLVRAAHVYAIGKIGGKEYAPELMAIAKDQRETDLVRAFAVLGVGLAGESAALPVVSQITRDNNYTIGSTFLIELWTLL